MDENRTNELLDKYEDALMALLMNEYAEQNGARLLEEYEEAERSGAILGVPEMLDKKCRDMIHHAYAKHRSGTRKKSFARVSKRVASITLAMLGLCSVLVVSVEAFRTPIVNFVIEQHEKYSTIDFGKDSNTVASNAKEPTTGSQAENRSTNPLGGMIPVSYNLAKLSNKGNRGFACLYKDGTGNTVAFSATPTDGLLNVDTEGGVVKNVELLGHAGMLVEKNGYKMVWFDENVGLCYQLRSTAFDYATFWSLAETVAACQDWPNIIFGG